MLILCIVLALTFDFINGFNDSSAIVASVISSRALAPRWSLRVAALGEFLGPFVFGVAVARTIGSDLLHPGGLSQTVILAALVASISWDLFTWYTGIPSSSSHALVGGLVGAAAMAGGWTVVKWPGLMKIVIALTISPPLGLLAGYLITKLVYLLSRDASPRINNLFRGMQVFTSFGLALSHGGNDAQKTMGVITLLLLISGIIPTFHVPLWVILASASAIAFGASVGGWRQIRTLGGRIFRIRPVHGVSAQIGSAIVIAGAALLGGPVSTTQVMSSSILGTGAAERLNKVRWQVGREMLTAWLLTIPITAVVSALVYLFVRWLSGVI
jgi:PiT family inorganic phosphate transporter